MIFELSKPIFQKFKFIDFEFDKVKYNKSLDMIYGFDLKN